MVIRRSVSMGFGLLLLMALLVGPIPAHAASPYRVERTVSMPVNGGDILALSGSLLLWQETSATGTTRIDGIDLATQRPLPLPPAKASQSQPALAGLLAAWIEQEPLTARPQLITYDLDSHHRTVITDGEAVPSYPAVDGTTVVWRDRRGGEWAIYGYDLVAGTEFLIAGGENSHGPPAISGQTVVWSEYRDGSWDVYAYNLAERRARPIAGGPGDQVSPKVSNERVAYIDRRPQGGAPALKVLDLKTGASATLTDTHLIAAPAITGDMVVWEDWRDGMAGVFAYDLAQKREIPISRAEQVRSPLVEKRTIIWLNLNPFGTQIAGASLISTLPSDRRDAPLRPDPNVLYFPETGHTLGYGFKSFWQQHGGLAVFGYPLTEEFSEVDPATGRTRTVQYFERFRLEYDPREDDVAKRVSITRLGAEWLAGRTPAPLPPIEDSAYRRYFPETGHTLSHGFKEYWDTHDGLWLLGFPISEEMQENGRIVQYFERGRLEVDATIVDPDTRIGPGLLGRDVLAARGWLPGGPAPAQESPLPAR